ncbi:hypothetical protein GJ496_008769 [Pomphorhynchus laevis]|nr:hypothetical protein GJ496_008769 [Pomphorhynchus laevis]
MTNLNVKNERLLTMELTASPVTNQHGRFVDQYCDLEYVIQKEGVPNRIKNLIKSVVSKKATVLRDIVDAYIPPKTWKDEYGNEWQHKASVEYSFPKSVTNLRDRLLKQIQILNPPIYGFHENMHDLLKDFSREILRLIIFIDTDHASYFYNFINSVENIVKENKQSIYNIQDRYFNSEDSDDMNGSSTINAELIPPSVLFENESRGTLAIKEENEKIAGLNFKLIESISKARTAAQEKHIEELIVESNPDE